MGSKGGLEGVQSFTLPRIQGLEVIEGLKTPLKVIKDDQKCQSCARKTKKP